MGVGDDEVREVGEAVERLERLEGSLDVDQPVEEEGGQREAQGQVREELVPVALHRSEDVDREGEDGDEEHPGGGRGDRLQPGGRRRLQGVVVADGEPQRTGEEPPDGDVDRPDRPHLDGADDVDDVEGPDHEQGDVKRPDQLAVLATLAVAGEQGDGAEHEERVPGPGAPDAEPLAPHPTRAAQAREHVEERAEVHHRQPGEDHAVDVFLADAREGEPRDTAEGIGRDELHREHAAEEVDDGQPDDRGEQPVTRRPVRKRRRAGGAFRQRRRGLADGDATLGWAVAFTGALDHRAARSVRPRAADCKAYDETVILLSSADDPRYGLRGRCASWSSRTSRGSWPSSPGVSRRRASRSTEQTTGVTASSAPWSSATTSSSSTCSSPASTAWRCCASSSGSARTFRSSSSRPAPTCRRSCAASASARATTCRSRSRSTSWSRGSACGCVMLGTARPQASSTPARSRSTSPAARFGSATWSRSSRTESFASSTTSSATRARS